MITLLHEYFSHDYAARSNPKLQYLIADLGTNGYGCYWSLIEELYKQSNSLFVKDIKKLAKVFNAPVKKLTRVIYEYGLFSFAKNEDGEECFYSEGVEERLAIREQAAKAKARQSVDNESNETLSEKRRRAVMTRWNKKKGAAIQNESVSICTNKEAIQTDTKQIQNTPYNKSKSNSNSSLTTTTTSEAMQNGRVHAEDEEGVHPSTPAARPVQEPTPLPPSRSADDIAGEVRELMGNENIRYQLHKKSGGMEMAYIAAFIPEFAGQLALQGNTETGTKLAMHFGYWLGKKNDAIRRSNKNGNERDKREQYRRDMQAALGARVLGYESIDDILNHPAS